MANVAKLENIIVDSLKEMANLILTGESSTSMILAEKRNGEKRFSEQELKYIFLEKLIKESDFLYSVETPTKKHTYNFTDKENLKMDDDTSLSANIDISVYTQQRELISNLEFKHGQTGIFEIKKDLLKMVCELDDGQTNYFVHYVENKTMDDATIESLIEKFTESMQDLSSKNYVKNFRELSKHVKVYLMVVAYEEQKMEISTFTLDDISNRKILES